MTNLKAKVLGAIGAVMVPTLVLAAVEAKRFKQLTVEDLTPEQHEVADEVLKVSSLGIQGSYNVMLRSPIMAKREVTLPASCLNNPSGWVIQLHGYRAAC